MEGLLAVLIFIGVAGVGRCILEGMIWRGNGTGRDRRR